MMTSLLNMGTPVPAVTLTPRLGKVDRPVTDTVTLMGTGATVVDAHVHLLPGRIGQKVRAFFTAGQDRGAFTLAYPADHVSIADQLVSEGITEIWNLPYSHKTGIAEGLNEASRATMDAFGDHPLSVVGGATVHPDDDDPTEVVRRALDVHGLSVLKLHCSVGDFPVDDPRLHGAFTVAAERRMPVVIHLGHAVNGLTEEHEIDSISRLCSTHPDLPVVLAHFGHHSARQASVLFDRHPQFHADLTPVVTARPDVTAAMLSAHPDRILFGTDAPNTAITAADHVEWLRSFGLGELAEQQILGDNARRLVAAVLA